MTIRRSIGAPSRTGLPLLLRMRAPGTDHARTISLEREITMSYTIIVTRTWYHVESDEVETWQTDPHRTERDSMEYDDDAREEYGSPVKWAVAMLGNERIVATPGMAGFPVLKPSGWPIPDAIADTWWMSGYTPDNYTNEECETTVRLSGEWAPEQRAQVFRMATEG